MVRPRGETVEQGSIEGSNHPIRTRGRSQGLDSGDRRRAGSPGRSRPRGSASVAAIGGELHLEDQLVPLGESRWGSRDARRPDPRWPAASPLSETERRPGHAARGDSQSDSRRRSRRGRPNLRASRTLRRAGRDATESGRLTASRNRLRRLGLEQFPASAEADPVVRHATCPRRPERPEARPGIGPGDVREVPGGLENRAPLLWS